MNKKIPAISEWRDREERLRSSFRRLAASRLPVNLYSAQAREQRRAALLLHGSIDGTSRWEELDGCQLAEDERGDRMSVLLGGTTGGVTLDPQHNCGLIAAAGVGTLYLTNIERLAPAAQHVLRSIVESGRYTPIGDPYPRPITCRIIVATTRPLAHLARHFLLEHGLATALGQISLRAEEVTEALMAEEIFASHPGNLAAAS